MVTIKGFDNYSITRDGRVFSHKMGKFRKLSEDRKGYKVCSFYKDGIAKTLKVHRLVAQAYIPNPENKPQVNHIDHDVRNNKVENLEWVTNQENMAHSQSNRSYSHTKKAKNPKFRVWSFLKDGNWTVMKNTTVAEFCEANKFDRSTLYAYIDTGSVITRGKMKGYMFIYGKADEIAEKLD